MTRLFIGLILSLAAPSASAHVTSDALVSDPAWTYDPYLVVPLYLIGIAFLLGTRNVWRSAGLGRGVRFSQVTAFWTGWLALAVVVVSPLHWLGEHLFMAHMAEHELLMLIAAPMLALARPSGGLLWSLPLVLRRTVGEVIRSRPIATAWAFVGHPVIATFGQAAALWLWHMPRLYVLALSIEAAHRVQHLSFFFSALLFWWVLLHGRGPGRGERTRDGLAVGCLFITVLNCGVLGALMTLSTRIWYPAQVQFSLDFGLTPLEDQQLAGLLMWVPMGLIYTAAALFFAHRMLTQAAKTDLRQVWCRRPSLDHALDRATPIPYPLRPEADSLQDTCDGDSAPSDGCNNQSSC
jgi:cytochrome c oxidase assembly factor CtaG